MKTVQTREEFLLAVDAFLPRNCIGAELGVLNGDFSAEILRIVNPELLILVDPYITDTQNIYPDKNPTAYSSEEQYQNILKKFKSEISNKKIYIHRLYSQDAVELVSNNSLDLIYIDASHTYEDVKRDLSDWLPKMKSNSVIAGHDYTDDPNFGVIAAVDEFCKEHNFEMITLNENGGDFALRRKEIPEWAKKYNTVYTENLSTRYFLETEKSKEVRDYAYGKDDITRNME